MRSPAEMDVAEKRCRLCKTHKPISKFKPGYSCQSGTADGYTSRCVECLQKMKDAKSRGNRVCPRCVQEKPPSELLKSTYCRKCSNEYCKERGGINAIKHLYGLSQQDVQDMLESQGWLCAICRGDFGKRGRQIDHCHRTGKVRGLLCSKCNMAIGLFDDNPERAASAAEYLVRHKCD